MDAAKWAPYITAKLKILHIGPLGAADATQMMLWRSKMR